MTLSSVKIGDYELKNINTVALDVPEAKAEEQGSMDRIPTLGMDAFRNVVLTIDYQSHELLLRNRDYDVREQEADAKRRQVTRQFGRGHGPTPWP